MEKQQRIICQEAVRILHQRKRKKSAFGQATAKNIFAV
jgi:hypothetical protein